MALKISVSEKHSLSSAQAHVLFVEEGFEGKKKLTSFIKEFPFISSFIEEHTFSGKKQTILSIPLPNAKKLSYLVLVGLGRVQKNKVDLELYRRAVGLAIRFMQKTVITTCAFFLPDAQLFGADDEYVAQQTTIIAYMADYLFNTFKKKEGADKTIELLYVLHQQKKIAIEAGIETGSIIGDAVSEARQWVNLPANVLPPQELASQTKKMAKKYGLQCTVFDEKKINALGMGGLAAVSQGSEQDCQFVILEYKSGKKNVPTLGLVGKGITYDSGGLSLKPSKSMETMKEDMSGAAAVIAAMKAIAQLKPAVNIVAVTPLAENLPSGVAIKPGDIIRMYNGKTVEVKNTDAEGRLILADALAYMEAHYKPDMMIDLATLTGACQYALGPFLSGLFSTDDTVISRVTKASVRSGDAVWRLPLTSDYEGALDSPVADLCNIANPKYMAGATTAAVFLKNFVGKTPWAHLDIAGTAFNVPDISYYSPETATGVGVRLLVELALDNH